jgi:hypothetical protein
MSHKAHYRWFAIGIVILTLVIVCFLTIRSISITPPLKSSDQHTHTTSTRLVGTSQVLPTPTPSVAPTPVLPHMLQISNDPYTNSTSQHKTEVEPASYAYGSTIVTAFQVGRFFDHGSTNIGWATSTDGGTNWQHGFLPATTIFVGGQFGRITDPSVAYDAMHHTWIIASIAFLNTSTIIASAVLVSLSTNGGTIWSNPMIVADVGSAGGLDKDWLTCDNTSTSRFYGHCYLEWDNYNRNDLIQISTSSDGGRTWGPAQTTGGQSSGFSGYPLIQPDGKVIVSISNADQTVIKIFTSIDGGTSWSQPHTVTTFTTFPQGTHFRNSIFFTAGIDNVGTIYLIWLDCRFESNCNSNDLVMMTSADGNLWSSIHRIPITSIGSGISYSVIGLGIDQDTASPPAHLGLAFYYYAGNCFNRCNLSVGFVSSLDGGTTWSTKLRLADPFPVTWAAAGNNSVGDYITVCFSHGRAFPIFAAASVPSGGNLDEAIYTMSGGLAIDAK